MKDIYNEYYKALKNGIEEDGKTSMFMDQQN
jgi:hypothetical protein